MPYVNFLISSKRRNLDKSGRAKRKLTSTFRYASAARPASFRNAALSVGEAPPRRHQRLERTT